MLHESKLMRTMQLNKKDPKADTCRFCTGPYEGSQVSAGSRMTKFRKEARRTTVDDMTMAKLERGASLYRTTKKKEYSINQPHGASSRYIDSIEAERGIGVLTMSKHLCLVAMAMASDDGDVDVNCERHRGAYTSKQQVCRATGNYNNQQQQIKGWVVTLLATNVHIHRHG